MIDYRAQAFEDVVSDVDLVLDTLGRDPADGGAEELNKLRDRVRAAYLQNGGMGDLLRSTASPGIPGEP